LHVSASMRLFTRLLACYDYRLPEERQELAQRTGYSLKYLDSVIRRLKKSIRELWAQHIRDVRAIGLASVVVSSRRRLELDSVSSVDDLERTGLPWPRYLYSYRRVLSNGSRSVYSYLAPIGFLDEMVEDIAAYFDDGRVDFGFVIPARFRCDQLGRKEVPGDALIEEAERALSEPPPSIRPGLLEVLLYARLDDNPLATYRELQDISPVLVERLGRPSPLMLKYKKVVAAYAPLSRKRLVGRALLLRAVLDEEPPTPLYVSVRAECASRLYALITGLWASPSMFVGGETASAVLVVPDAKTPLVEETLGDCMVESGYITTGFGTFIPVEMFSPKNGWTTRRQPIEELLVSLGLAERHGAAGAPD